MKILEVAGKIRFGDEVQQARGGWVNLRDHVSRKRQMRLRVEDHHRRTGIGAGKDPGIGEIAAALGKCRHCRKRVERILRARAGVVDEEKRLVAAMIYLWNIQRAAEAAATTLLRVTRLERLAGQRIRSGVERRIVNRVKQGAVRAVDVEAAAPAANDHDGRPASAKPSPAEPSAFCEASAPESLLLAKFLDTLVDGVAAHRR